MSKDDKLLDLTPGFVLSAGAVTVDPTGITPSILVILHNGTKEYLLAKGRKDIGETLSQAALRETYEETGYRCMLKPHKLPTRATQAGGSRAIEQSGHMEPIACQQRITMNGVRKIIFWYYAEGDSTAVREQGTQDEGEDFTSMWVEAEKGVKLLTFDDDKRIARLALRAMEGRMEDTKPE